MFAGFGYTRASMLDLSIPELVDLIDYHKEIQNG